MSATPAALNVAPPTPSPALPPLSHHDVLARAEPFPRAGLALDLEASDRMARRLGFTQPAGADGAPTEHCRLEDTARGRVRLTRTLRDRASHEAGLVAQGGDAARLLAVLGWNWARLVPARAGWTSRLRLRASGPAARTERADAAFARAAALGLVALVLLSALLRWQPTPLQMILMYHLPTLVIALSFLLQELPRFELPPWPRVLRQPARTIAPP